MHESYKKWLENNKPKIICQCGCNGEIIIKKHHIRYGIPKYLRGHNPISESTKQKMRDNHADYSGKNHPMYGKKFNKLSYTCMCKMGDLNPAKRPEVRKKISDSLIGKHPTIETIKKLSNKRKGLLSGNKNPNWKGGITSVNKTIRHSSKYFEWRLQIFGRDNFMCQDCNIRGTYLEAHHIKPFNEIIKEYNIKTIEDALNCDFLWDLNNGVTYCLNCHNKLKKKGGIKI